jgi:hypothetical protein
MTYKEVSFRVFVMSASLCLAASIGFFLMAYGVLRQLDKVGVLTSRKTPRTELKYFLGLYVAVLLLDR